MVSYLPLSHIAAQIYDLWTGIQWGAQICFAQPDALKVSLPSAHMGVPGCVLMGPGCVFGTTPAPHPVSVSILSLQSAKEEHR